MEANHSALIERYRDAYRLASSIVGFGATLKTVGVILGGLVILVTLGSESTFRSGALFPEPNSPPLTIAGLCAGLCVVAAFWVCGVLVAAQGQVLRATLDGAVAVSPFLDNAARAIAMGVELE